MTMMVSGAETILHIVSVAIFQWYIATFKQQYSREKIVSSGNALPTPAPNQKFIESRLWPTFNITQLVLIKYHESFLKQVYVENLVERYMAL